MLNDCLHAPTCILDFSIALHLFASCSILTVCAEISIKLSTFMHYRTNCPMTYAYSTEKVLDRWVMSAKYKHSIVTVDLLWAILAPDLYQIETVSSYSIYFKLWASLSTNSIYITLCYSNFWFLLCRCQIWAAMLINLE